MNIAEFNLFVSNCKLLHFALYENTLLAHLSLSFLYLSGSLSVILSGSLSGIFNVNIEVFGRTSISASKQPSFYVCSKHTNSALTPSNWDSNFMGTAEIVITWIRRNQVSLLYIKVHHLRNQIWNGGPLSKCFTWQPI